MPDVLELPLIPAERDSRAAINPTRTLHSDDTRRRQIGRFRQRELPDEAPSEQGQAMTRKDT